MPRWERSRAVSIVHTVILTAVFVLMLLATLSTPLLRSTGYLTLSNGSNTVRLGTLGYCVWSEDEYCSSRGVGYDVHEAVKSVLSEDEGVRSWYKYGTKGLIVVPVGCGVAGLAALTSLLGKSAAALIWSTLLGILTTILSLGAVILNATLWPPLRRDALSSGATSASYGSPIRFVIASLALSALAPIIAGIEACAGCIKRRHERGKYVPVGEQGGKRGSTYRQSAYELPLHVDLSRPVDPIRPVDLTGSADLGRSADVARPAETAK